MFWKDKTKYTNTLYSTIVENGNKSCFFLIVVVRIEYLLVCDANKWVHLLRYTQNTI